MRRVIFFMMTTLDGYFEGVQSDLNWHVADDEFDVFANDQLAAADVLLFGRTTYSGMAEYWPTPEAAEYDPRTAELMNTLPKVVFSRTLPKTEWQNTQLVAENIAGEIAALKAQPGKDLLLLASSNLAVSLLKLGLIDEIRVMLNPVVLGNGTALFKGIEGKIDLRLLGVRAFGSGNVLLTYAPIY